MGFRVATTAILFWGLMCTSHAQRKAATSIPAFVYGIWQIRKLDEVGGHAGEKPDLARRQIGKKIRFGRTGVNFDRGFLFFDSPCRRVSYTFEARKIAKQQAGEKGTLEFHGLNPAKEGQIQNVVVKCNGRPQYYFELAERNELAIYYDGWFFFLEKVRE